MLWVDRSGKAIAPIGPAQEQWPFPELSPDGRYVAIVGKENEVDDVWIHDAERGTRTRLSATNVPYSIEAWSPDGKSILYNEGTSVPLTMKIKNVDGGGETRTLHTGYAAAFSTDGRYAVFADTDKASNWNLWYIDTTGDAKPAPLLVTPATEGWPRISPDGKYFAYVSDESGADEIYLKRFPQGDGRWQVTVGGGQWPRWNRRGDRIYYAKGDAIMEVDVASGPEPRLGTPREVFTRKPLGWPLIFGWAPGFDFSADEKRFVVVESQGAAKELGGILVEENWTSEFKK
jgi:Tol biopolymer transport system component